MLVPMMCRRVVFWCNDLRLKQCLHARRSQRLRPTLKVKKNSRRNRVEQAKLCAREKAH
jgi:hypothetical protein